MDFSTMLFLDDSNDLDETLMKTAMDFVNALACKSTDGNSMVPNDEDVDMDTDSYYESHHEPTTSPQAWVLQINSPPASVPYLDETCLRLVNIHDDQGITVPNLPINTSNKKTQRESGHAPEEQRVPYDSTPVLDRIDVPRAPKRKIFDLYRNHFEFFVDKENAADKPPIVLKFSFTPLPNRIDKDLEESFRKGILADPSTNIRAEFLFDIGCLPIAAGKTDAYDEYKAISHSLYIDERHLRLRLSSINKNVKKIHKSKRLDLDKEYDNLLLEQVPFLKDKHFEEEKATVKDLYNVFELDGSIYIKLRNRVFVVPPSSVIVPRLSEVDIEAVLATRTEPKDNPFEDTMENLLENVVKDPLEDDFNMFDCIDLDFFN